METPNNIIESPNYSREKLQEGADKLVVKGGAWDRVKDTSSKIYSSMSESLYTEIKHLDAEEINDLVLPDLYQRLLKHVLHKPANPKLKLYRSDLVVGENDPSGGQSIMLTNQHCWPNGPGFSLQVSFKNQTSPSDIEENVQELIESWEKIKDPEKREEMFRNDPKGLEEDYIHVTVKPRRETLAHFPREVEKWVAANKDVIPEEDQKNIAAAIVEYRQAYSEISDYIEYAKGYMKYIDGKAQETVPSL